MLPRKQLLPVPSSYFFVSGTLNINAVCRISHNEKNTQVLKNNIRKHSVIVIVGSPLILKFLWRAYDSVSSVSFVFFFPVVISNSICALRSGLQCWTGQDTNHQCHTSHSSFYQTKHDFKTICRCRHLYSVESEHIWVNVFGLCNSPHVMSVCNRIRINLPNK